MPLENHLCVPYDHLPPRLARRQMDDLAAAFLVCLEAEPSSSHHGVNAGTGRALSPAMTLPRQPPINHFPRRAASHLPNSIHVDDTNLQLQAPDPACSSSALALHLQSEADETPDGGEFFWSSWVHLVKSPWKKQEFGQRSQNLCPEHCSFNCLILLAQKEVIQNR